MKIRNNPNYYVSKLSNCNSHTKKILNTRRGFYFLRKGDCFDFALDKQYSYGGGRIYRATSDYYLENGLGFITAEEEYNPEV